MALATDEARVTAKQDVGYVSAPWRVAIQQEVLELLRVVTQAAEREGLTYFAINGTLLGAEKFQGLIPWEDDADLGIVLSEVEQWQRLLVTVTAGTGYRCDPITYGWVLSGPQKGMLDLIVFAPVEGVYRMAYPLAQGKATFLMSLIRKYEFPVTELLPLKRYPYDGLLLWGPADGRSICHRAYGKDVFIVNKRPDGGHGIHPYWPAIARALNPLSQGCAELLSRFPGVLERLQRARCAKKSKV